MTVKALIFDMDGLMIDSERLYHAVQQDIARSFGKELTEDIYSRMMGRKPLEALEIYVEALGLPASAEELLRMRNEIMREKLTHELKPMPGLGDILDAFRGTVKLAVATGAQQEFLDLVVDRLGIRGRFEVLQSSDGLIAGKPDPKIYLVTCQKLGLAPRDCIVLEDSGNGALAGKRAGCAVIAVPTEYTQGQDFSCADAVARDLVEARFIVEKMMTAPGLQP